MVKGFPAFRRHFLPQARSFVIIGGAACDAVFTAAGLTFRATRDIDLVLFVEGADRGLTAALRDFVREGGYRVKTRSGSRPERYRFSTPTDEQYPSMVELFSRAPQGISLGEDQHIVPVPGDDGSEGLSAILLDDEYHRYVADHHRLYDGIRFATPDALIMLKARAWTDLTARRRGGATVDRADIDKHRNDVFRLAALLPADPGPLLPPSLARDLASFLAGFPEKAEAWVAICDAVRPAFGRRIDAPTLLTAVHRYFGLPRSR